MQNPAQTKPFIAKQMFLITAIYDLKWTYITLFSF